MVEEDSVWSRKHGRSIVLYVLLFFRVGGGESLTVRVEWCYLIAISQLSSSVFHFYGDSNPFLEKQIAYVTVLNSPATWAAALCLQGLTQCVLYFDVSRQQYDCQHCVFRG